MKEIQVKYVLESSDSFHHCKTALKGTNINVSDKKDCIKETANEGKKKKDKLKGVTGQVISLFYRNHFQSSRRHQRKKTLHI